MRLAVLLALALVLSGCVANKECGIAFADKDGCIGLFGTGRGRTIECVTSGAHTICR